MLNFGASKPRVKGGPGPPPESMPVMIKCVHLSKDFMTISS